MQRWVAAARLAKQQLEHEVGDELTTMCCHHSLMVNGSVWKQLAQAQEDTSRLQQSLAKSIDRRRFVAALLRSSENRCESAEETLGHLREQVRCTAVGDCNLRSH